MTPILLNNIILKSLFYIGAVVLLFLFRRPFEGLLKKLGGISPVFKITGDMDVDMANIRSFYSDISGRYPEPPLL